jgi:hypothetical protein
MQLRWGAIIERYSPPGRGLRFRCYFDKCGEDRQKRFHLRVVAGAHRTYGYYLTAITRVPSPFTETSISAPKNCLYWFTDEPPLSKQIHIAGNIGDKKLLIKQLKSDAARSNFTCKVGAIKNQYLLDIRPIEGTGEIVEKWHLLYSLGTSDRCYKSEIELSVRKRHTY